MKKKLDLRIRKESFASEDSTNESLSGEDCAKLSPRSKLNKDLASDYGSSIETYLKTLEKQHTLSDNHLGPHELKATFRARMVDWMCEVLNIAFSNISCD